MIKNTEKHVKKFRTLIHARKEKIIRARINTEKKLGEIQKKKNTNQTTQSNYYFEF